METLETPLWILEQANDHDLKIGMVIVELPNHKMLHFLDTNGHFQPAVLNQILQILVMMRGGRSNEGMINSKFMDKFPEFPVDEDLILLQFQKHYLNTTQTACLPLTAKGEAGADLFSDNVVTNKYFKEATFSLKYTLSVILKPTSIVFTLNDLGDKHIVEEEVTKTKSLLL